MATRYVRDEEIIPNAINAAHADAREALVPTGTEKAQTTKLAQDLKVELDAAQLELTQALATAAEALDEAGLARTEAGQAVQAAADAAAQATDAFNAASDALDRAISADGRLTVADVAPVAGDGAGKPIGALWIMRDAGIEQMWELTALGWVLRPLDETIIPKIAIGTGTYGDLAGDRLVARSIVAGKIEALSLTANELAANSVTAVKIAANAVIAEKIQAGAVVTDKLDALAVTAAKLAVGSVIAEKIATGAIIAGKIQAQAIDGMVITGATVRTAASGQRVQMDITGIRVFNSSGVQTTSITPGAADGGGMLIDGILEMRRNSSSPGRVYLASDGLEVTDNAGGGGKQAHVRPAELMAMHQFSGVKIECPILNGTPAITLWAPGADGPGVGSSVIANILQYGVAQFTPRGLTRINSGGDFELQAMQPGSNILLWGDATVDLRAGSNSEGTIRMQSRTTYVGDLPYTMATANGGILDRARLMNNWANNVNVNWNGMQTMRRNDMVHITGAVTKGVAYASLETILMLPPLLRPEVPTMMPAAYGTVGGYVLVRPTGEVVTSQSGAGGQIAIAGTLLTAS